MTTRKIEYNNYQYSHWLEYRTETKKDNEGTYITEIHISIYQGEEFIIDTIPSKYATKENIEIKMYSTYTLSLTKTK